MIDVREKFRKLGELDWGRRIAVVGTLVVAATVVAAISFYIYMDRRTAGRSASERADMLSAWLADVNVEALSSDRPELADLEAVSGQHGVRKVVLFDARGRLFAPLSMHGGAFSDRKFFGMVMAGRKTVKVEDENGDLEVFRPISGDTALTGVDYGMVYLVLEKKRHSGFAYPVFLIILVAAAFFLFIIFILKETSSTVSAVVSGSPGRRFDRLERGLKQRVDRSVKEAVRLLEAEWRKLTHAILDPIIVLDANCRLVEINEAAMNRFGNQHDLVEGRHIVDVLDGNGQHEAIIEILGEISNRQDGFIRLKGKDSTISAFASASDLIDFKYTIVCSGNGGGS